MTGFRACALIAAFSLAACDTGGLGASKDSPYAPAVDRSEPAVDGLLVGWRLMDAGEYELAMDAFVRAAVDQGRTPEVISAVGTANLVMGRLGQAETMLREATQADDTNPETWNNLGVALMEQGKNAEAEQILRRAYALDNGESDAIRDNLRLALAKSNQPSYADEKPQEYKLVRRGSSDYLIRQTP
ncbi:tetratricopeptide repeat protein [Shimia sp. R9_1]|uniref:tetratricopeptide repeat protein n=1 Tax=unclassified Shimia TaxID=2630038 RepID=UPI001ADD2EBD|nr:MULTISPECIES: tetratricopeptide repeat protein [unclassified Shimia]MBO9397873.1 tetratricopeptide repeat protein [Shimia sp. R9_2]MBO9402442.1 tetratricopeptide repeat protein [Shimia sp. R9_3]MBO9408937.1 tetratricopeptide repeat protein [Shimia sp. R9_1]